MGHRHDEYDAYHDHREHDHDRRYKDDSGLFLLRKLLRSRHRSKILVALGFGAVAVVLAGIAALALAWPLLTGAVEHVEQNGVQGAVNEVTTFLQRLWTGSGGEAVEPASTH